jgi:ribonucrease Y
MSYQTLLMGGVVFIVGLAIGYFTRKTIVAGRANSVEQRLNLQIEEAKQQSKEILLEAKDKSSALFDEFKNEERERKRQLDRADERLVRKEESLEKQIREIRDKEQRIEEEVSRINSTKDDVEKIRVKAMNDLEAVAGLSREDARDQLIGTVKEHYREELGQTLQKMERERREEIEKKGNEIILGAIQRYARSSVSDITTSVFTLPNEDLKGKIIGREGRNIRTLERLTGVEIIVDETPESIILSSFDPLRRETAKLALEKLIKDGRIQPAKIEEKVEEAKQELDKRMIEIGESSALDVGIIDLPREIQQLLGRLHFRTSYGQNVLIHSVEMAHLAGMIAGELGLDVDTAKRGALLHDIGKSISHEVEGTHVELGRKLLKKYGIDDKVIAAMESHHDEYPFSTPESYVVAAVDALSAARPGARRDSVENYLKRVEELEKIAEGFPGIKAAYALSAGREVRVFVTPEKIDDFGALQLAKDIATKIQSELKYPGEVKVNVIREMRAVEYAR